MTRTNARWKKLIAYIRNRWGVLALSRLLREAGLRGADLYGADLYGADLYGADLYGAGLYGAGLRGADLREAGLRGADLRGADLRGVNLRGVNLYRADLRGVNLRGVNLYRANLYGADLYGANFENCQMNWESRNLIAERLRQAAGDDPVKRLAAGYILVSRDWCWDKLLANAPAVATADGQPLKAWALDTMRQWALPGSKLPHALQILKGD